MMKKRKISDFGQKIGGAKKDLWASLKEMSEDEKAEAANRDLIWRRPDYQKLVKNVPKEVLYWRNEIRKSVKTHPDDASKAEEYIRFVGELKEKVEGCASMEDIFGFYREHLADYLVQDENRWMYAQPGMSLFFNGNAMLRYANSGARIASECAHSNFLSTKEEKEDRKYSILRISRSNLVVRGHKDGLYSYKAVISPEMSITVKDQEDWLTLIDKSADGILRLVAYGEKRFEKLGLCLTDEEAEKLISACKQKNEKEISRKASLLPPHLSSIRRTGSSYKRYWLTDPNILSARYHLRGGEFGNYETSKDRLGSLNMAYDAFEDLADAVGIQPKDIGLGDALAIAFGARGKGNALAHYEPERNVINITRLRGAGSLAHEWGHALDKYLGSLYGCRCFMTALDGNNVPQECRDLVTSMLYRKDGGFTRFYADSKELDGKYQKAGNGYWSSHHELFARAFACFVHDQLGDKQSDYLVGHSEFSVVPADEEREEINSGFRKLFAYLIETGVFSKAERKAEAEVSEDRGKDVMFFTGTDGQMRFC